MFVTRKLGKVIRGPVTLFHVLAATLLGSFIGFSPGFGQAPGWNLLLLALLVLLNANLILAGVTILLTKLLYLLFLPVLFHLGVALLEGPLQGLFALFANAPVSAWFGLEYYVVTGGIAAGAVIGTLLGLALHRLIHKLQEKLGQMQEGSEKYQSISRRKWVRALAWVFFGGLDAKGKKTYRELAEARGIGNPIRPLGAVLVALVTFLLVVTFIFLDELVLTQMARNGLERVNRATVDLERLELVAAEGRLALHGLALADRNDLQTDLFRAERLVAEISGMSLLRRQVALDRVEAINASTGETRRLPGRLIGPPPREPRDRRIELPDTIDLEDVLAQARVWRGRLAKISEILERIGGAPDAADPSDEDQLSWRENLALRAHNLGYANVTSDNIIRRAPRLTIGELMTEGMRVANLPDERIRIQGNNLSTHPHLLEQAPALRIEAQSGRFGLSLQGGAIAASRGENQLQAHIREIPVDEVAAALAERIQFPFSGGTFDVQTSGTWRGVVVDLPVEVTARDTQATLLGQSSPIREAAFPIRVTGPLVNPSVQIPADALQTALRSAATGRLRDELSRQLDSRLGEDGADPRSLLDRAAGGLRLPSRRSSSDDESNGNP
jgi:hypothetical protein